MKAIVKPFIVEVDTNATLQDWVIYLLGVPNGARITRHDTASSMPHFATLSFS
jgi:hypothetical protein